MLKQLGRLERTRNWFIIGFIVLMAVSLVIFYAPNRGANTTPNNERTEVVAKVGWDKITLGDVVKRKEEVQKQYAQFGNQINLAQMGITDASILDALVQRRVMIQEAKRLGLLVSDAEVADELRRQLRDPATGKVDNDRYKDRMKESPGGVEKFEEGVREDLAIKKLRAIITAGVSVSDQEVLDDFRRKNTSFELSYVLVSADKVAEKITPVDADLQAYFNQHKAEYFIKDPQKQIRYLYIEQAKLGSKLIIPDNELLDEYNRLTPEQKQAGVNVQQIVLKVPNAAQDADIKAKATAIVQEARGTTGTVTEEAFGDLAKGKSQDTATSTNGGHLAGLVRKNPNNPKDPLQQTLDMTEGAITEPIKFGNNYYIFRRGTAVSKKFEDAKPELLASLQNRKAYAATAALAKKAVGILKANNDVTKAAAALAAEANMPAASMVRETPFVKPGDDVKDIGVSQQFEGGIAPLNNVGDVGIETPIKGGFAIPVLIGKKDPRDSTFDEVKAQVTTAVKAEKAKAQIEQTAKDIIAAAKSPADLTAAAQSRSMEVLTAKDYKVGSPLGAEGAQSPTGSAESSPALEEAILALKEGQVAPAPIKSGENWIVVGATKRTNADDAEYVKQKAQLTETMLSDRRGQVFDDYVRTVQDRMTKEGSIKIYKEELAKLNEGPDAEDPTGGGLPGGLPGRRQIPIPPQ
jgi:peptidyl-prolyl cis-trans isomerase D